MTYSYITGQLCQVCLCIGLCITWKTERPENQVKWRSQVHGSHVTSCTVLRLGSTTLPSHSRTTVFIHSSMVLVTSVSCRLDQPDICWLEVCELWEVPCSHQMMGPTWGRERMGVFFVFTWVLHSPLILFLSGPSVMNRKEEILTIHGCCVHGE
jgi:hypothetical protein